MIISTKEISWIFFSFCCLQPQ